MSSFDSKLILSQNQFSNQLMQNRSDLLLRILICLLISSIYLQNFLFLQFFKINLEISFYFIFKYSEQQQTNQFLLLIITTQKFSSNEQFAFQKLRQQRQNQQQKTIYTANKFIIKIFIFKNQVNILKLKVL
ncbi:hypothetical protein ABPG72_000086 [Tetrahymena utriculariae]